MPYVLIVHEVESYPAWKEIFDQAAGIRKAAGEIHFQLLCSELDPNNLVHFSEWSSFEDARQFFESPKLDEIRRLAGVKLPKFLYLTEIEQKFL